MSPLEVSISTSAPSDAGARMAMSPEPVSTWSEATSRRSSAVTPPLPVSSESSGDVDARPAGSRPSRCRPTARSPRGRCRSRRPSRCRSTATGRARGRPRRCPSRYPRSGPRRSASPAPTPSPRRCSSPPFTPLAVTGGLVGIERELAVHVGHGHRADREIDRDPLAARHLHQRGRRGRRGRCRSAMVTLRPSSHPSRSCRAVPVLVLAVGVAEGAVVPHPELGRAAPAAAARN